MSLFSHGKEYRNSWERKIVGRAVALPAAIVATPIILFLAAEIRHREGISPFFKQKRISELRQNTDGSLTVLKETVVWKLQTMVKNADSMFDAATIAKINRTANGENDPRITPTGKLLRKFDLDELPQLWQVVFGDMDLVEYRAMKESWFKDLLKELPNGQREQWLNGFTSARPMGLFHPGAASGVKIDKEKAAHDIAYAEKASLAYDAILLWQIGTRLGGKIIAKLLEKPAEPKSRAEELKESAVIIDFKEPDLEEIPLPTPIEEVALYEIAK